MSPGRRSPGRRSPGHLARIVAWELLHALAWAPLALLGILAILFFHLTVPIGAAVQRAIARRLGAHAASGRPSGERLSPWLLSRVAEAAFWRQDLPLCLGAFLLGLASAYITSNGLTIAVAMITVPLSASRAQPVTVRLNGPALVVTDPTTAWWLILLGVAVLALTAALLLGVGVVRLRLITALSGDREEPRVRRLRAEVGQLTASRATLMDAFEVERARIERDLHDGAQQDLVALTMSLGALRLSAESLPDEEISQAARASLLSGVDAAQDRAEAALGSLRETVHGIRPEVLSERGLVPALRDLAGRAPLPTAVVITGDDGDLAAISPPVATVVYFAVAEALTNAAKHARAGHATVTVRCSGASLNATVSDDGVGGADPRRERATGLRGMEQRVESIGGRLEVHSPPGGGTRLSMTTPLVPPWGAHSAVPPALAGPPVAP
ncbi:sensor histidine kinase [Actinomyces capricornis]|uniref:histidine kinase n=1 Tax=Actinomyces capricornis TaxID=2755559 RepID=A0ABM7UAP4_9ACTO|nr:sensor histidine kinase [Actinomyces capricornis]BDA64403.1 hypothetical protein MANAM107_12370 [Actinomyces capricornis]